MAVAEPDGAVLTGDVGDLQALDAHARHHVVGVYCRSLLFGHEEADQVPADLHDWRMMVNDEGQRYKTCARCGAYRDFDPRPGMA